MNSNFSFSSTKRGKCQDGEQNELIMKKSKLVLSSTAVLKNNGKKPSAHVNILTSDKQATYKPTTIDLVSLISCEYKKIDIYPGQIVWSRCNKSPFWPSIVWRTKTGKPMNENNQVLVKCFATKGDNVWIKLENIFPFDGVESFKEMKNSVNMNGMTLTVRRDFAFAFNASNELWPRAVAEAIFCISKPVDERMQFFFFVLAMDGNLKVLSWLTCSSSKKFQNDENIDKSNSSLMDFRINEEFQRITSYLKNVDSGQSKEVKENKLPESASLAMPTFKVERTYQENVKDLRKMDEKFLTFVMKSLEKNTVFDDIGIKCKMLTENQHICVTHRKLARKTWHTNFCHICYEGGLLLQCTTCPQSFHETCMHLTSTTDNTCSDCINGRHPVYGDTVLAKMYVLPWPAIIVPPCCIPSYMKNAAHREHDLCVRFFEIRKFKWIRREFVYPFGESDLNILNQSQNNPEFKRAILSATKWFRKMKLNKENQFCFDNKIRPMPYEKITENIFVAPAKLVIMKNREAVECECDINDVDPCGLTSNCLNRMTYIECDDLCQCDSKCGNKCIQLRVHAKVDLKFFGDKGFGIKSSERIAAGSFVIDYVGEVITELEYERRVNDKKRQNCYIMKYTKGLFIDAESKGNLSRFINHSCNPNCRYEIWTSNGVNLVAVIAEIDIPEDTEITCTYQWSGNTPCLCNEPNCAKLL